MPNAIEIKGLSKQYDGFALKNLNLELPQGTILGLIGANGAGKTTTLKLILNLISRDSGTIQLFGKDNIKDETELKEQIGVVFDECCFHEVLKPKQLNSILGGIYKSWDSEAYFGYLKQFNLPENKVIKKFSRGMKMKLSIAAALSHHPKLLVFDEPTGGLDPVVRDEILDLLLDFLQDETKSIILSSHIISDLEKIADYIALIDGGELLFSTPKDELLYQYSILKGSSQQLAQMNKCDLIRVRQNHFGFEALVKEATARKYPDMVHDRPSLEEIMLFFTRGTQE